MQLVQTGFGLLFGLVAPLLIAAQTTPATIIEPPRQEMQTVAPNLPVGPYLMSISGKTFVNDVFLDVALTAGGKPVPDGTEVAFDAVPTKGGDAAPVGGGPILLMATTTAGHAKLAPAIPAEGDWDVTLTVAGPAGSATAPAIKMGVDPHRPPVSLAYRLSQVAIPIVVVALLLGFFRLRHIELEHPERVFALSASSERQTRE